MSNPISRMRTDGETPEVSMPQLLGYLRKDGRIRNGALEDACALLRSLFGYDGRAYTSSHYEIMRSQLPDPIFRYNQYDTIEARRYLS